MYDMHITHINRSSDAIGARVKRKNSNRLGFVEALPKDASSIWCDEYQIRWDDGESEVVSTRDFEIVVELVHGAKYMTMAGDIRTLRRYAHDKTHFQMHYNELGGSDSSELVYPNGSTYHYDCGMNLLKRMPDDEVPRRAQR